MARDDHYACADRKAQIQVRDFGRDTGWPALLEAGFRPVRQVAIDAEGSARRFRRQEFVKFSC